MASGGTLRIARNFGPALGAQCGQRDGSFGLSGHENPVADRRRAKGGQGLGILDKGRAGLLFPGDHAGSRGADRRQVHGPLAGEQGPDPFGIRREDVARPPLARDAVA